MTHKKLYKNRYFLLVIQLFQVAIRDDVKMRHLIMKEPKHDSHGWPIEHTGDLNVY